MIKIINLSDASDEDAAGAVYVGRAMPRRKRRGSPLGNPHKIDKAQGVTRDMAIEGFAADLAVAVERVAVHRAGGVGRKPTTRQERMVAELDRLTILYLSAGVLTLACWCHPQSCHVNVIASHIQKYAREIRDNMSGQSFLDRIGPR